MTTQFETIDIKRGHHKTREQGMCVMEFWAKVRGIAHTDHPPCACPVFTETMVRCNDTLKTDAARNRYLRPFALRLAGMKLDSAGQSRRRRAAVRINKILDVEIALSKKAYDEVIALSEKAYDDQLGPLMVKCIEELLAVV